MKNTSIFTVFILIVMVSGTMQGAVNENLPIETTHVDDKDHGADATVEPRELPESAPTRHFVPVHIEGYGNLYPTAFYVALVPMVIAQFIYLCFELIGLYPDLPLIDFFLNDKLPDFLRHFSDVRSSRFPLFLSCPFIHINQQGGTYTIGNDKGAAFNGALYGFTGVAWERSGRRILIKGFAVTVDY